MANMYTAMALPPREELAARYNSGMSQAEVGATYGVTQKVIHGWMRKLDIPARVPVKRNQSGASNSSWRGDEATYAALHYRVYVARGKPKHCEHCGKTSPSARYEWANVSGNYADIHDYIRLCKKCHIHFDEVPAKSSATQRARRKQ
jgi:hypothetical protein